eukprot:1249731-Amorphochlora_amoeboformis.AAC.1
MATKVCATIGWVSLGDLAGVTICAKIISSLLTLTLEPKRWFGLGFGLLWLDLGHLGQRVLTKKLAIYCLIDVRSASSADCGTEGQT